MIPKIKIKYKIIGIIFLFVCLILAIITYSYVQVSKTMKNQASEYANTNLLQLDRNITMFLETVENSAHRLAVNKYVQNYFGQSISKEKIEHHAILRNLTSEMVKVNTNIIDIMLVNPKGEATSFYNYIEYADYKIIEENYDFTDMTNTEPTSIGFFENSTENKNFRYAYILPFYWSLDASNLNNKLGYIVIITSIKTIENIIDDMMISEEEKIFITTSDGDFIYPNKQTKEDLYEKYDTKKIILVNKENEILGWNSYYLIPINTVIKDIQYLADIIILIGALTILLMAILWFMINRTITHPIDVLVNEIKKIDGSKNKDKLDVSVHGEFSVIVETINKMLLNNNKITKGMLLAQKKLYQIELLNKQIRLHSLESQINPHFLYNTLECMRSIGSIYNIKEIVTISTSMAKLFRYSIKSPEIVKISDELDAIREYMRIINIRFTGRIKCEIQADEDTLKSNIPKMILQPIVENSVYHGIEPKIEGGKVDIICKKNDHMITLTVTDNGVGIPESKLEEIKENCLINKSIYNNDSSIGVCNIYNRVLLIYGEESTLDIESDGKSGTKIVISIPSDLDHSDNLKLPKQKEI